MSLETSPAKMKYYSLDTIFGYQAFVNFVFSGRGTGKSYSFKEYAIKDFLKTGAECGIARRNSDEIAAIKNNFWDDIAPKYDLDIRSKGNDIFARAIMPEFLDDDNKKEWLAENPWVKMGKYFAISEQQSQKGSSFPRMNKLLFDEFIIENTRQKYIPNEPIIFHNLMSTIFRDSENPRVVAFANAGALANPYFRAYGVRAKDFDEKSIITRNDGTVLFQRYHDEEVVEFKRSTAIARSAPQEWLDYAVENEFADGGTELIEKKPLGATPVSKVTADGKKWLTIYRSDMPWWWIGVGNPKISGDSYSVDQRRAIPGTVYSPEALKTFKRMFHKREIRFQNPDIRELFLDWLQ